MSTKLRPPQTCLLLPNARTNAHEGLFAPATIRTPFDQRRVLSSLVRITENVYWDTIVLDDTASVNTLKKSFTYYEGSGRKTYLPEGSILWHIVLSKSALLLLMEDPKSPYEEGISDIVRSFRDVQTFPAERIAGITGWANATFISQDGLLLTNYHVVREQIEALGRQLGCAAEVPAPFLHAESARVKDGRVVGWAPLTHLDIVANLSSKDWQAGLDGALLRVRDRVAHGYLPVSHEALRVGEAVWMYGFPFATHRPQSSLTQFGYENADTTLRVSVGAVTALKGVDFTNDTDGISGDSGGAVVDQSGALVGYDWDINGQHLEDRVTSFSGGNIAVTAATALSALMRLPACAGTQGLRSS